MIHPNSNAFPWESRNEEVLEHGLSKREYFALHLLQGLLANANNTSYDLHVSRAVKAADMLIAELNGGDVAQPL